ncbi:hypothetical protein [Streptomyces oryzae]|uniref:hypothetical protein n=1 Tax=Streptomyces oryzae TaxID=1434886 RepID=UPI001FFE08CD|nr:hypothetical protein [Streptomyces oryzae]
MAQVLVAKAGDDLVPVGGVAEGGGGDPPAPGPGEQAGVEVRSCREEALGDQGPDLFDQGDLAGPLALGAFVDQPAQGGVVWRRTVQIQLVVSMSPTRTPELADAGGGAGGEDHDVAPAEELAVATFTPGRRRGW